MNNTELMLEINRLSTIEKLKKENKILNDKIEKIKKIVNRSAGFSEEEKAYNHMMQIIDIKEVLEQE